MGLWKTPRLEMKNPFRRTKFKCPDCGCTDMDIVEKKQTPEDETVIGVWVAMCRRCSRVVAKKTVKRERGLIN